LRRKVDAAERAWHDCAAVVDSIVDCQEKLAARSAEKTKK